MIGLIVRPQVCAVLHDDWVYLIDGETASRYFIHSHQIYPSHYLFPISGTVSQRGLWMICLPQQKIFPRQDLHCCCVAG